MVFMVVETAYPATEFTQRKQKLDEDGVDLNQIVAKDVLNAVGQTF